MVSDYTPPPVTQATLKGAPYVTVSPVGLAQGLPRNNNANFGPDTPGTTTSGIQEAINFVYASAVTVPVAGGPSLRAVTVPVAGGPSLRAVTVPATGGPSLLMQTIVLLTGSFQINAPITIPAPSSGSTYGPNIHVKGAGIQNSILNFNFNTSYGITISTDNQYGMFVFEGFSPNSGVGYTPGGWLQANFYGTSNAAKANMIIRDVNVYPATWSSFSMVATGLIQLVLENYWDTTNGTGQNGPYLGNTMTLWQGGSCYAQAILDNNYVFKAIAISSLNIEINTGNGTYIFDSCVDVRIATSMGIASPIRFIELSNCIITNFVGASTNTIWADQAGTITTLRIRNLTFGGSASGSLLNPFVTVADYKLDGALVNTTPYTYTMPNIPGFSANLPANPPVSGTTYQNTEPYEVDIYIPITYNPTASSPAQATGYISPVTPITGSPVESNNIPAGLTSEAGLIRTMKLTVPPGWYWAVQVSNATIGTAVPVGK